MDNKTKTVLTYLETEIKKEIDAHYAQDCCIAATRIGLDVLDHFQIPARPVATRVIVCNAIYTEWVLKNDTMPMKKEQQDEVFGSGGWAIIVGVAKDPTVQPTKGKGFGGHLVAYLDEGYLLDLSIPQANRPRYNIRLRPLVVKAPNFLKEGGVTFKYPQKDGSGLLLSYTTITNEKYTGSIDWQSDRRRVVSYPAIAALDQYLRIEDGSQPGGREPEAPQEATAEV